jgi:monoterpene epsilon-lactone hydrolase
MTLSKTAIGTLATIAACVTATTALGQSAPVQAPKPTIKEDGTVVVPAFDLPYSSLASPEARAAAAERGRPGPPQAAPANIAEVRRVSDESMRGQHDYYVAHYPYTSDRTRIGNVPVEIIVPKAGIAPVNRNRLLIAIHGGGGTSGGGGLFGRVEALPVAGEARIKTIAVDYRLRPEHTTQEAVDDVLTVYRDALRTYRPENIGMFGCSAGGRITGLAITAMIRQKLPVPAAAGIFCASLPGIRGGDSSQLWPRLGSVLRSLPPAQYEPDPMAPTTAELRRFPPTLFLTGTRAPEMSAVAQSSIALRSAGVHSELVLFDGMDHGFFMFGPTYPESHRAVRFMADFFLNNLGTPRAARVPTRR